MRACVQMKQDLPPQARRHIAPVPFAWQWSPAVVVAIFLLFSRQVAPGTYTAPLTVDADWTRPHLGSQIMLVFWQRRRRIHGDRRARCGTGSGRFPVSAAGS